MGIEEDIKRMAVENEPKYQAIPSQRREQIMGYIAGIIADIAPDEDTACLMDEEKRGARIREMISLDSMDFLDIVMELRKRHKVEVPEYEYMNLATMRDTVVYLADKVK